jgi:hypothetical protein
MIMTVLHFPYPTVATEQDIATVCPGSVSYKLVTLFVEIGKPIPPSALPASIFGFPIFVD